MIHENKTENAGTIKWEGPGEPAAPAGEIVPVKKEELEKWVVKMREDREFREAVKKDMAEIRAMFQNVSQLVNTSNPLASVANITKLISGSSKIIDTDRLTELLNKY